MNSRFVTYPSTVDKGTNHKVVLIDAVDHDIEAIGLFLAASVENFDVYLYEGANHDLEWLNLISSDADHILINDRSQVQVTDAERYQSKPLAYFERIEQKTVDNTAETLL